MEASNRGGLATQEGYLVIRHKRSALSARSYTLIELIMVMIVLSLAAALLVPHLVGRDVMVVQAAVRHVIADLTYAQSDAQVAQEFRRVHFPADGSGYFIYRIDQTADFTPGGPVQPSEVELVVDPLKSQDYEVVFERDNLEGVSFDMAASTLEDCASACMAAAGGFLTYDPLGGLVFSTPGSPGVGGTIILQFGDQRYEIIVSAFTGKLSVNKL